MRIRARMVALMAALTGALALLTGCGPQPQPAPSETYGGWPTFLPSPTDDTNQVLTGSQEDPALTVEGDAVRAELPDGGTVLITVTGPVVPGEGLPDPPPTTVCTWTITLTEATVPVGIAAEDFAARDSTGQVYHPSFIEGRPLPPDTLQPGGTVSFELRTPMSTGEGIMQWAPDAANPVATWDFVVEND